MQQRCINALADSFALVSVPGSFLHAHATTAPSVEVKKHQQAFLAPLPGTVVVSIFEPSWWSKDTTLIDRIGRKDLPRPSAESSYVLSGIALTLGTKHKACVLARAQLSTRRKRVDKGSNRLSPLRPTSTLRSYMVSVGNPRPRHHVCTPDKYYSAAYARPVTTL